MAKNKHLTQSERIIIELRLGQRISFRKIAKELEKSTTTISNEITAHLIFRKTGSYGRAFNDCKNNRNCEVCFTCSYPKCKKSKRKTCSICYKYCKYYEKVVCTRLLKAPFVCNGCTKRMNCSLEKRFYEAKTAQNEYDLLKSESRTGICSTEEELIALDEIITPLINQGQSIHVVCENNRDKIMLSERTIYNYIGNENINLTKVHLPRTAQRVTTTSKKGKTFKVDKKCRIGRTYEDYQRFIRENDCVAVVQMDSLIGNKGGKVLLTIHFVVAEFMIGFIRNRNNSASVTEIFNDLYKQLGKELFIKLFPVILTDNGSEFSNPLAIEFDEEGNRRTYVFYCNPQAPYQKGAIENNHEFFRRIVPKGTSLNDFTQSDIDLAFSHINSYKRKSLSNKSPYEMFNFMYGQKPLEVFRQERIQAKDIVLKPKLLY